MASRTRAALLFLLTELPTRAILPVSVLWLLAWPPSSWWHPLEIWALVEICFFCYYLYLKRAHTSKAASIPAHEPHLDRQALESPLHALERMVDDLGTAIGEHGDRSAEVTSWFLAEDDAPTSASPMASPGASEEHHPRWSELRRENVQEWLAWAFWNADRRAVPPTEMEPLVQTVERWVLERHPEQPPIKAGYNPRLFACRLTLDTLRCKHRPLVAYVVTHMAVCTWASIALRTRGFRARRDGNIDYWHFAAPRPPPSSAAANSSSASPTAAAAAAAAVRQPPIVFIAGMGVGLVSYLRLVDELMIAFPSREMLLIEVPYLCMRLPTFALHDVPSPEQTVLGLRAVLAACGAESAHWIGHSFGTVVMSWVLRLAPRSCVAACTFIDPIPFLLFKSNVAVRFVYRPPATAVDRLVRYFVTEEIGISHALHRHFSWPHNVLRPDVLEGVPTAVVLSEHDSYVPSDAVGRHLKHNAPHVDVLVLRGHVHSQFILSPEGPGTVIRAALEADGRRQ
jgi:pimeloyl-ACP methyl ester carboxylesterase